MKRICMIFFKSSAGEINLIPVMVVIAVLFKHHACFKSIIDNKSASFCWKIMSLLAELIFIFVLPFNEADSIPEPLHGLQAVMVSVSVAVLNASWKGIIADSDFGVEIFIFNPESDSDIIAVLVEGKCAFSRFNLNGGNEPGLLVWSQLQPADIWGKLAVWNVIETYI